MLKRFALVAFLAILLAGCKVDTTVSVRVQRDGSGVVTVTAALDAEAVKAAETGGGKLEDRVRLGDLGGAGWTVKWTHEPDGSARLVLRKPFRSPTEVGAIMHEVSGTAGPLRNVTVTRDQGLLSTRYKMKGSLDLAQLETGVAADPDVVAALTNQKVDLKTLDESLLAQVRDSLQLSVTEHLPGRDTKVVGKVGKTTSLETSTSVLDTKRVGLILGAILLVALAVLVLWWPRRWSRRRPRRRAPTTT